MPGFCVLCATEAQRACQRCGDYYCSVDCQRRDWQRHRYICFSPPALVHGNPFLRGPQIIKLASKNAETTFKHATNEAVDEAETETAKPDDDRSPHNIPAEKLDLPLSALDFIKPPIPEAAAAASSPKNAVAKHIEAIAAPQQPSNNIRNDNINNISINKMQPEPPNNCIVVITGFRSPNTCYVRKSSDAADKAYEEVCSQIDSLARASPMPVQYLNRNQQVVTIHHGRYERALVLDPRGYRARLLMVERGSTVLRKFNELREVPQAALDMPRYSFQMRLADVAHYASSLEIMQHLEQFVGVQFTITHNGKCDNAELIQLQTQQSLNAAVRAFCADKKMFYPVNKTPSQTPTPSPSPLMTPTSVMKNKKQEVQALEL